MAYTPSSFCLLVTKTNPHGLSGSFFRLLQNLYIANIASTTLATPPKAPPIAAAVLTELGTEEAGAGDDD
jgi:hypothetical protein